MRLLVVGAEGQLGRAVVRSAQARGDTLLGGYASRVPAGLPEDRVARIDKNEPASFASALRRLAPDWIVDTGALHQVDYCESHPQEAFRVNRDGSGALAREAIAHGAGFVFVSTDYVFDGTKESPYAEEDVARPLNLYGRSKLEGESLVLAAGPGTIVVRPSVVYSWIPPVDRSSSASQKPVNFGSWVIDQLVNGKDLRIVDDQIASPTFADDLAAAILALIDRRLSGVYHCAGTTAVNRFAFTVQLAKHLGLDGDRIVPVQTASLHQAARRPSNSSLDSTKLSRTTGYSMSALPAALDRLARSWRATAGAGTSAVG